jgi:two-component system cell cycle sensor histidine kinase/response regulator CckA
MGVAVASRDENRVIARAYAVAGLAYPVWSLVAPGPSDPRAPWFGIGACMLLSSFAVVRWRLTRDQVARLALLLGSVVTLHFFLLASANHMSPFYAVGSSMAMLATLMNVRSVREMGVYALFVGVLTIGLYAVAPNPLKLAYWGGPFPAFLFAYRRLNAQTELEQRLEREVAQRTEELSAANRRLRDDMQTRERLKEALSAKQKVEAVARMAGSLAHDFNNLLTTIGVYAELISEALPADSALQREVDQIQQAQRQAASLTQQLLTLGRHSHVRLAVVDLEQIVSDMAVLVRRVLDGHELVLALDPRPQAIRGNVDQIRQVVLNLVLNARDAMRAPGRVTISIVRHSGATLAKELGLTLGHDAYVELAVSDTGDGMSDDTRSRAFDPFFSTKPPERGSGLGLSTVHAVVDQADGHVRLISEAGRGTRCELYWPLANRPVDVVSDPTHAKAPPTPHVRILLVEDEEPIRNALVRVLSNAGHTVAEAGSTAQALAILEDEDRHFDLLITDVVMPNSSGLDLAEQVTERWPGTRVLLISGFLNDHALGDLDARFAFLAKPFTPKDLQGKVREVLASPLSPVAVDSPAPEALDARPR